MGALIALVIFEALTDRGMTHVTQLSFRKASRPTPARLFFVVMALAWCPECAAKNRYRT